MHINVYSETVSTNLNNVDILEAVKGVITKEVSDVNDVLMLKTQQNPHFSQCSLKQLSLQQFNSTRTSFENPRNDQKKIRFNDL